MAQSSRWPTACMKRRDLCRRFVSSPASHSAPLPRARLRVPLSSCPPPSRRCAPTSSSPLLPFASSPCALAQFLPGPLGTLLGHPNVPCNVANQPIMEAVIPRKRLQGKPGRPKSPAPSRRSMAGGLGHGRPGKEDAIHIPTLLSAEQRLTAHATVREVGHQTARRVAGLSAHAQGATTRRPPGQSATESNRVLFSGPLFRALFRASFPGRPLFRAFSRRSFPGVTFSELPTPLNWPAIRVSSSYSHRDDHRSRGHILQDCASPGRRRCTPGPKDPLGYRPPSMGSWLPSR